MSTSMSTQAFLVLPTDVFRTLSDEVQEAVLAAYRGAPAGALGSSDEGGAPPSILSEASFDELPDERTDLTPLKFKELVDGCGVKTKAALKAMVEGPTRVFRVAAVAKAVGCAPNELRGVWGGLTKRIHKVTSDPNACLLRWHEDAEIIDGRYIDQGAEMSEASYNSGRRVFNL